MDQLTRLAQAARLGDAAALESFIRASQQEVWRFCAGVAGGAVADDLTQETYARCVRSLRQFRGDASALTWILSIARNVCASELRSRMRTRVYIASAILEDLDWPVAPDAAEQIAMADLIGRLDPDRRSAFVLTQVLGLPYAEAAAVCGCPIGTIRSRVARAREDLIARLTQDEAVPRAGRQAQA